MATPDAILYDCLEDRIRLAFTQLCNNLEDFDVPNAEAFRRFDKAVAFALMARDYALPSLTKSLEMKDDDPSHRSP